MPVPIDSRGLWDGTAASIPANWTRYTASDDRYLQGDGDSYTGPVNGGSSTHTHTSPGHTHTSVGHTHTVSAAAASTVPGLFKIGITKKRVLSNHTHASVASSSKTITVNSTVVVITSTVAQPLSARMIVIKPDDALQDLPDDVICFADETTLPTGFEKTDGLNGTSDYDGRFVIGASVGGDGGGLLGAANHGHATTSHTHTTPDHGHAQKQAGVATFDTTLEKLSTADTASTFHHLITLGNSSTALSSKTPGTSLESNDPAFIKMLGIQNKSGAGATPTGVILPYVGTPASVPGGWQYCNGDPGVPDLRDRQIQITTTDGQIGVTGGSDTHTHTGDSHDHSFTSAHTHSQSNSFSGCIVNRAQFDAFGGAAVKCINHSHTWTIGSTTPPNVGSSTFSLDSAEGRYLYRTVIFIKKVATASHLNYERMHRGVMRGAYRGAV